MPLKAYEDWAPEPLAFPIGGKVYTIPRLHHLQGIKLWAIVRDEEGAPEDPVEQNRLLMGDVWDEMVADSVPIEALNRAALTCWVDFRMGRETAEQVWESGLTPEALAPKGASPEQSKQPSTESETPTPSPDSTPRTTSRPASSSRASKKSRRSASPKSSPNGS